MARLHHVIYVVELDRAILGEKRFRDANPKRNPELPCLYIGSTGLTPEERFENHRSGHKGSRFVRKYGLRLRPDKYEHYGPMAWEEARRKESDLAGELRSLGYGIWQH